jgi:hypothetical protein
MSGVLVRWWVMRDWGLADAAAGGRQQFLACSGTQGSALTLEECVVAISDRTDP